MVVDPVSDNAGCGAWVGVSSGHSFGLRPNLQGNCPVTLSGPHCGENHQFGHFPLELCGNFSHNEGRVVKITNLVIFPLSFAVIFRTMRVGIVSLWIRINVSSWDEVAICGTMPSIINTYRIRMSIGYTLICDLAHVFPICAVGDHCETKTLKFAGLLMSID